MQYLKLAVCEGRHEIPAAVDGSIFGNTIANPFDWGEMDKAVHQKLQFCSKLDLYVTGLTPATLAVVNYCLVNLIELTCWHYNASTGEYVPQKMQTTCFASLLREGGYIR